MRTYLTLAILFAGMAMLASAQAEDYEIIIDDSAFTPDNITIVEGDTVIWVNDDDKPHTVESNDTGEFDSENLNQGQNFTHTFYTVGNYSYHCDYHSLMTGTVNVEEAEENGGSGVGTDSFDFDSVVTELEVVMNNLTHGEMTATAEFDGPAANELRYYLWLTSETITGGEMDEANATISMTMVAAFMVMTAGGDEVVSDIQLNGVNGTVTPGALVPDPLDALVGTLKENDNEPISISMSQTLSFNVTDPGDSPAYFFEGDDAGDNVTLPVEVEITYRFVAPDGWIITSTDISNGTIVVNGEIAEFVQSAGELVPDMTITLGQPPPPPYDCDDEATYCIGLSDNLTFTPDKLSINTGDTVVFVWSGSVAHNVAQVDDTNDIDYNGGFRSGNPTSEDGYWILPAEAIATNGTFYYVCEPHAAGMRGSITVGSGADEPDDGGEPPDDASGIPGPGLLLAAGGIAAVALRRRH